MDADFCMRLSNPIETLAAALAHAAYEGLPDLEYDEIDHRALFALSADERAHLREREKRGEAASPRRHVRRRPSMDECEVVAMFGQTWGSTALGFGGIGGQAITTSYTCLIRGPEGHIAVYWHGRFAYLIDPAAQTPEQRSNFESDLAAGTTEKRSQAAARYGAVFEGQ